MILSVHSENSICDDYTSTFGANKYGLKIVLDIKVFVIIDMKFAKID